MSKTATCGTPGSTARARASATSAGPLCSGASEVSSSSARSTSSSASDGLDEAGAAVDDPVPDRLGLDPLEAVEPPRADPSSWTRWSFRLVEPALTTRTSPTGQSGQAQSRTSG